MSCRAQILLVCKANKDVIDFLRNLSRQFSNSDFYCSEEFDEQTATVLSSVAQDHTISGPSVNKFAWSRSSSSSCGEDISTNIPARVSKKFHRGSWIE